MSKSLSRGGYAASLLSLLLIVPGEIPVQAQDRCIGTGHLSQPVHTAKYLEVFGSQGFVPNWSAGRLARPGGAPSPDTVEVYDREGKHLYEALIRFPGLSSIYVLEALPLTSGLLATGHAYVQQQMVSFIAKIDDSGSTTGTIETGHFMPTRLCGQPNGTIWAYGRDLVKEQDKEPYSLLRQYSLENGLLREYLPRDSVAIRTHGVSWGGGPSGTYLSCGANVVSLYMNQSDEFVQVDTTKDDVKRWHVDMTELPKGKVTGLGVLQNGCVYASLHASNYGESETWGLFVLKRDAEKPEASWRPLGDTVYLRKWNDDPPEVSIWTLWGAESDELIIKRYNYERLLEWVTVR